MKQPPPLENCFECGWYRAGCPCGCHCCCAHPQATESTHAEIGMSGIPQNCPLPKKKAIPTHGEAPLIEVVRILNGRHACINLNGRRIYDPMPYQAACRLVFWLRAHWDDIRLADQQETTP